MYIIYIYIMCIHKTEHCNQNHHTTSIQKKTRTQQSTLTLSLPKDLRCSECSFFPKRDLQLGVLPTRNIHFFNYLHSLHKFVKSQNLSRTLHDIKYYMSTRKTFCQGCHISTINVSYYYYFVTIHINVYEAY